jgi:hypothetical protein
MDRRYQLDTLAEILTLNQALGMLLQSSAQASGEPQKYLRSFLEKGLAAIQATPLHSVTAEEKTIVLESAADKFADLITTTGRNL